MEVPTRAQSTISAGTMANEVSAARFAAALIALGAIVSGWVLATRNARTVVALGLLFTGFGGLAHAGTTPPSVSVGGQLFIDVNGDGSHDPTTVPGDRPLSGVFVKLVGPDGSPVTDVNGAIIGVAETGVPNTMSGAGSGDSAEPGRFEFLNLPVLATGESYTVSVESPSTGSLTLTAPSDGILATSALDTAGASDDTLEFVYRYAGPATQATIHPAQEFPLSTERHSTSLIQPGVPTDIVFTMHSIGTEPIVNVNVAFSFGPGDDRAIVCDPPATPDDEVLQQILVQFAGPFDEDTSINCRFTIRALNPGEKAGFSADYAAFGETSGTLASGDSILSGLLIASAPETTTTTAGPTTTTNSITPTTVATTDPAVELPETGSNRTISGWAIALVAAGMLMLITARRRTAGVQG